MHKVTNSTFILIRCTRMGKTTVLVHPRKC